MSNSQRLRCGIRASIASMTAFVLASGAWALASGSSAALSVSAGRLAFYVSDDAGPPAGLFKVITISNGETHPVNWAIPASDPWILVSLRTGTLAPGGTTSIGVSVDVTAASPGAQTGTFTLWDADAAEPIRTIDVFLRVCRGVCVSVDLADAGHTVSPLLFGSQIDFLNSGNYLLDRPPSPTCTSPSQAGAALRPGIIPQLRPLGLRMLRYPSGIPSDFFHWFQALGPVAQRVPQIDPWKSTPGVPPVRECPIFGPDEFLQVAGALGTEILTTSNAGTGSVQEAAAWLVYNLQRGIPARYWEFGNEAYLQGFPDNDPNGYPYAFAAAYMSPDRYAAAFDDYARTLRSILPSVKVGAIASLYGSAAEAFVSGWNGPTFAKIQERADFVSVHFLFPLLCTTFNSSDQVFRFLLAAPAIMEYQLDQLKQTLARVAVDANKAPDIAITEHAASFFCLDFGRNHTLASALFSALSFNTFFRDPRIIIANHANLSNPLFQAPLMTNPFGADVPSAFYHVFRLYAQAAGSTVTSTSVLGAPTFSTDGLNYFPSIPNVPVLDSVAAVAPDTKTLRLYVVNRSLTDDVTAHVAVDGSRGSTGSITVATVNGATYESANSLFDPYQVILTARAIPASAEFDMTFPAHSVVLLIARTGQ
jgi:alpha-N-arabinofuranosidase